MGIEFAVRLFIKISETAGEEVYMMYLIVENGFESITHSLFESNKSNGQT